jgi:hypothetical protein
VTSSGRDVALSVGLARSLILALVAGVVVLEGCAAIRQPIVPALRDATVRDPVVLIPGITGTRLRDRESGEILWGTGRNLVSPRDGGYSLALSVEDPLASASGVEPFSPILGLRLFGVIKKQVYAPLLRLMERNGYRAGDLAAPRGGDDFFFFNYDWRLGVEQSVRGLADRLRGLREARGEGRLRVDLICQSDAALIARYFVKYGAATLEEAEAGSVSHPEGVEVDQVILVGTSNGGSLRILHEMNQGRRYVPVVGRRIRPETLFTYPAMYEGLPVYEDRLFFDASGALLDLDLFDAANWERYGWSLYSPEAQQKVSRSNRPDLFGDAEARRLFLQRMLDRAARLHRLLQADPEGFESPRYYFVQNAYASTPERALLVRKQDRWRTYFVDDRAVRRDPYLLALAGSPGDGHATLRSQGWLSPKEREALALPPVYVEGTHFGIILEPAAQRRILEYLLEPHGEGESRPSAG